MRRPSNKRRMQSATSINPVELDRSIDQVIHSREFTWRTPHAGSDEAPQAKWVGWVRSATDMVGRFIGSILDAFFKWFSPERRSEVEGGDKPVTKRLAAIDDRVWSSR